MKAYVNPTSGRCQALMLLVLMTFAFRALIPAGFMPAFGDGAGTMVICSGVGEKTVTMNGGEVPAKPDASSHDQPCGFSVNAAGLETSVIVVKVLAAGGKHTEALAHAFSYVFPSHAYLTRAPPAV